MSVSIRLKELVYSRLIGKSRSPLWANSLLKQITLIPLTDDLVVTVAPRDVQHHQIALDNRLRAHKPTLKQVRRNFALCQHSYYPSAYSLFGGRSILLRLDDTTWLIASKEDGNAL